MAGRIWRLGFGLEVELDAVGALTGSSIRVRTRHYVYAS